MSRSMTVVKAPTQAERLAALEKRADAHDKIRDQVQEMHDFFTAAKRALQLANKLWVKLAGVGLGLLGGAAAALTVLEKVRALTGH